MIHDSTWLDSARAKRWKRLTAPVGFLLACLLLAGFASTASATTYDMRGEWSFELKSAHEPALSGPLVINKMEPNGEFTGSGLLGGFIPATVSGTVTGTTTSLTIVASSPVGAITFIATSATIEQVKNTLSGSGAYFKEGKEIEPGTVVGTRLKTYQEVQEQEARELKEREEQSARANVRGEWSLTLEAGPETLKGIALITAAANVKNEFSSSSTLFEGGLPGTFTGTLKGKEASVEVTTAAVGTTIPPGRFTSSTIAVTSATNPASMSGSGEFTIGTTKLTGTLTATKIRTYQQIEEQETSEREAKEKQEREAREAAEKSARELKEKELKEHQEREAREAAERAAAIKSAQIVPITKVANPTLVSVTLVAKTLTAGNSGTVSLALTNPNGLPVQGHLKLTLAKAGKTSSAKHTTAGGKSGTLGEVSFSLASKGAGTVKLKLSKSWRVQLAHSRTLHVLVTLTTTQAAGQPGISKTYSLTLRAPSPAHHGKG